LAWPAIFLKRVWVAAERHKIFNVAQGAFFASTLPPRVQGERRALVRGANRKLHLTAWTNSNTYTTGEPVQVYLQINNGTSTPVCNRFRLNLCTLDLNGWESTVILYRIGVFKEPN
jgi:hypothetical protein